jgi:putative component of toxin-antitoxin plasmid stabilization module
MLLIRIQGIEEQGDFGDCQPVGEGISELRIHYAKGYRVYLKEHGEQLILLLIGGDKPGFCNRKFSGFKLNFLLQNDENSNIRRFCQG